MKRPLGTSRSILVAALAALAGIALAADSARVVRVIDGDTLEVSIGGHEERVRLIGVDTPETVHPGKPVERFGKEASAFTRGMAEGKVVRLEADPANGDRDRYGRLLRYVFLPDGTLLNAAIIDRGYGHAYTRFPFSRMEEFRELERGAREADRGLWGPTAERADDGASEEVVASAGGDETVFVTRSGAMYHREGCRYLSKSMIRTTLEKAASRYEPCRVCKPPKLAGSHQ